MSTYKDNVKNIIDTFLIPKLDSLGTSLIRMSDTSSAHTELKDIENQLTHSVLVYEFLMEYVQGNEEYTQEEIRAITNLVGTTAFPGYLVNQTSVTVSDGEEDINIVDGIRTFIELEDTPAEFAGSDQSLLIVDGDGVGFSDITTDRLKFAENLQVQLSGGRTFGKYPSGSTIPSAGKTAAEVIIDAILETLYPSLVSPSNSIAVSPTRVLYEVGDNVNMTFTSSFDRGSITPDYGTSGYRSGLPEKHIFSGPDITAGDIVTTDLSTFKTIDHVMILGNQSWGAEVQHSAGEQPYDSAGNEYQTPYAAGTTAQKTATKTGVYPWYATTELISSLTKQDLEYNSGVSSEINMVMQQTGSSDVQRAEFPYNWGITTVEQYDTNSGTWVDVTSSFDTEPSSNDINGSLISYTLWSVRELTGLGARLLRFS